MMACEERETHSEDISSGERLGSLLGDNSTFGTAHFWPLLGVKDFRGSGEREESSRTDK